MGERILAEDGWIGYTKLNPHLWVIFSTRLKNIYKFTCDLP